MDETRSRGTTFSALLRLAVVAAVFLACTAYAVIAFSAQDSVWFLAGFEERPSRVIVYGDGRRTEFAPGQLGFDELAEAVRDSLNAGVARQSGIGLSAGSLQDAYTRYVSVEAFFDKPVKLHAAFSTGYPNQMLFPVTGRHSDLPIVFLGVDGQYLSNGPVLNTIEPIRKALQGRDFDLK